MKRTLKRTRRGARDAVASPSTDELATLAAAAVEQAASRAGTTRTAASLVAEPAIGGFGSFAFSFPASTATDDEPWLGALVARLGPPGGDEPLVRSVEDEADWYRFAADHGFLAPPILAVEPATDTEWGVLVLGAPEGVPLSDRVGDPTQAAEVVTMLGAIHARIHQLPTTVAPGPRLDRPETLDLLATEIQAAGDDPEADPALAWLATHVPASGELAVGHGEVHPSSVRLLDGDGDGQSPIVTNWSRGILAEPEYDLARTLVMLWSTPYLATTRLDRSLMFMIRDGILETYRKGYDSVASADEERLTFWQTYHARYHAARARSAHDLDPWDPLAVVPHLTPLRRGLQERAAELTRSFRL